MTIWRAFTWPSFRLIVLLTGVLCTLAPTVVFAQDEGQRINQVKAAFVLNIARFVTWPSEVFEGDDAPMVLCYYRKQPFAGALDSIAGRTVAGRQLEIKKVRSLSKAGDCQILLISHSQLRRFTAEARAEITQPILTIADRTHANTKSKQAAVGEKGILVSLIRNDSRIGFEIDFSMSHAAGLKISSQLLKHARIVGAEPES